MAAVDITAAQCAAIAQTIPILFVLFIAERAIDPETIPHLFDWLAATGAIFLTWAEVLAFLGISGGLTGRDAVLVAYGMLIVLAVLAVTLAMRVLRKNPPSVGD